MSADRANELIEAGRGVEAIPLLRAASQGGDADASHMLAILTARGAWTPKDWPEAIRLLALAAEQGSRAAQTELGLTGPTGDLERLFAAPEPTRLCENPRVRRIDGFLSPEVCRHLIAQGRGRAEPAATLEQAETGARERRISGHRTNSAHAVSLFAGGVVMALIAERIARVLKVPTEVFEGPQIFHYDTGQEFQLHYDFIEGAANQRIATFLVYLNNGFEGGETFFPHADLKAKPCTGGAVYFANVGLDGAPDPQSLHAGLAATSGEKWLLSQWVREAPYSGD